MDHSSFNLDVIHVCTNMHMHTYLSHILQKLMYVLYM